MPDIQLRLNKDMLIIAATMDAAMVSQGANPILDRQMFNLIEHDTLSRMYNNEIVAGAQCVTTTTEDITLARLSHINREDEACELAKRALEVAKKSKAQHILFEIGPCGLPLDPFSKQSLNENKDQYKTAASLASDESVDALFLNGFVSIEDLKCALMGVAQVSDLPIIASVTISSKKSDPQHSLMASLNASISHNDSQGAGGTNKDIASYFLKNSTMHEKELLPPPPVSWSCNLDAVQWCEAVKVMIEYGVSVVGFETSDPLKDAEKYVDEVRGICELPLLAQLRVTEARQSHVELTPLGERIDYTPEVLEYAALKLRERGVQILRATGIARSVHTAALASSVCGLGVMPL